MPHATASVLLLRAADTDLFQGVATWPDKWVDRTVLGALAEHALQARHVLTERTDTSVRIALPIEADASPIGAIVVELRATAGDPASIDRAIRLLQVGAGWMVTAWVGDRLLAERERSQRLAIACEAIAHLNRHAAPVDAAMDMVNWLLETFECTRVGIGTAERDHAKLLAVSHAAWFDARSRFARTLENAMDEALDQRRGMRLPVPDGEPGGLAIAHRELAGANAVISVLLPGVAGRPSGVLLLERIDARPFSIDEAQTLDEVARVIGPVLEAKQRSERWVGGRGLTLGHRLRERLVDPRRPALRVGAALAFVALLALLFVKTEWRITADAAIEGEEQRALAAPFEGFVAKAGAKAGETVKAGQVLAELDRRSLLLEYQRYDSENAQHERRYNDALSRHDRSVAGVELAAMQEAEAHRNLAQDKLDRAVIAAPFDAVIVTGDLSQQVGTPVEQGKVLFELAPLDAYRVILKVDEHDIRGVKVGEQGRVVLAGLSADTLPFTVRNISIAETHDGRNVFRVEAALARAEARLRPGMQGVGKIDAGSERLIWIWTHVAWDWLTLQVWRWWP